jgi:D-alanine-D-alanine ligase
MRRLRVGILFGGRSAEHEISILSARNVLTALDRSRFDPVVICVGKDGRWLLEKETALLEAARDPWSSREADAAPIVTLEPRPDGALMTSQGGEAHVGLDVVFPVLHGPMGEDGTVQGLLELAGVPYVGAGVLGSALGMDKDVMKRVLRDAGIPIVPFRTLHAHDFTRDPDATCARALEVGLPLFVKPANLGSSVGVHRIVAKSELPGALRDAFSFDLKALAEQAIAGRELECSVLGNEDPIASLPGEIIVHHAAGFYSYEAKYLDEHGAALEIPAKLDPAQTRAVQDMAIHAFRALECSGLARVDFFLTTDGTLLVNEINTMPGFTAISMYPKLWEASGVGPTDLVTRLIDLALDRHARKRALRVSYEAPQSEPDRQPAR